MRAAGRPPGVAVAPNGHLYFGVDATAGQTLPAYKHPGGPAIIDGYLLVPVDQPLDGDDPLGMIVVFDRGDPLDPTPVRFETLTHGIDNIGVTKRDDGSYLLMDCTDENTKQLLPGYLCDRSYLVAHPEGETLQTSPIVPAEENMVFIETTGSIGKPTRASAETAAPSWPLPPSISTTSGSLRSSASNRR